MAILTKGQTFANADTVTSTKLNALVDSAAFVSGASGTTDDTSLEVNGSGRLQIKDLGVTSAKIATSGVTTAKIASATGASDGVTYAKLQHVANMRVIGNVSGSLAAPTEVSILDEDTMASDSATAIPTQQSVKAYVDANAGGGITRGTAVATTSGTTADFTSLPATIKRLSFILNGVSTNGTSDLVLRIGDSGGLEATGYSGGSGDINGTAASMNSETTGVLVRTSPAAARTYSGIITFANVSGNIWVASGTVVSDSGSANMIASTKTLTGTLDRITITTSGGANTFDAGSVNIMYE